MSNHLVHHELPKGALLEISPTQIDAGQLDDESGGYAIEVTDAAIRVRIVIPADTYVNFIRAANDQLDETGAGSGKIQKVGALPPNLRTLPR